MTNGRASFRSPAGPWIGGVEQLGACPICGSAERSILHARMKDCVFFVAPGEWTLWTCQTCRSAYLDPRPDEHSIGRAYSKYYTHRESSQSVRRSLARLLRISVGNAYRWKRFGIDAKPRLPFASNATRLFPQQRRSIDIQARLLPQPGTSRQRLLDIGCGGGIFLEFVSSSRRLCFGVEPDPVARKLACSRGFDVRADISEWDEPEAFDAITLNHVIEHLHRPAEILREAWKLLRHSGTIFVETPNIDSYGHDQFSRSWLALDVPRHLILFNKSSLQNLLVDAGFVDIRFHPRFENYGESALQSKRIAKGLDPFGSDSSEEPVQQPQLSPSWLPPEKVEFLTLTARKP